MTDHAIEFMKQHRKEPFLLYVSHFYVHTPVRAPTDWLLRRYQAKATKAGLDHAERRAHYGAFVQTLDHYVGQVLDALDRLDLSENTLVVFTSDNGGHPEYADNAPLRGSKWNLYEGGIRVPLLVRWPKEVEAGSICRLPVTGTDLLPTFCVVGQAPELGEPPSFESSSATSEPATTESAARVPGTSRKPSPGPVGAKTPETQSAESRPSAPQREGRNDQASATRVTLDGRSLYALLKGHAEDWPERPLLWHFPYYHPERGYAKALPEIGVSDFAVSQTRPQSALRRGRWKLLHFYDAGPIGDKIRNADASGNAPANARSPESKSDRIRGVYELYDLTADPGEQHNLYDARPEQADAMRRHLEYALKNATARMPERR